MTTAYHLDAILSIVVDTCCMSGITKPPSGYISTSDATGLWASFPGGSFPGVSMHIVCWQSGWMHNRDGLSLQ